MTKTHKITLSMIVRNEENRFLRQVLESVKGYINEAVIIDDCSSDNTVSICKEILCDIPLHLVTNDRSMYQKESQLRKMQWHETIKTDPEWILNLDADEMLEEGFWKNVHSLICRRNINSYSFRLYDMWNETHYREDEYWNAHSTYKVFLLKYCPELEYAFSQKPLSPGRFPISGVKLAKTTCEYRVKHFGWSTEKDRVAKYNRYKALDPRGMYGNVEQYDSIIDDHPTLYKWKDAKKS